MTGAFLGLKLAVFVIFSATLLAALWALLMLIALSLTSSSSHVSPQDENEAAERESFLNRELPFGVFLGVCSLSAVFIGQSVWQWYLKFFQ